jgi:hypothetical protein
LPERAVHEQICWLFAGGRTRLRVRQILPLYFSRNGREHEFVQNPAMVISLVILSRALCGEGPLQLAGITSAAVEIHRSFDAKFCASG